MLPSEALRLQGWSPPGVTARWHTGEFSPGAVVLSSTALVHSFINIRAAVCQVFGGLEHIHLPLN